MPNKKNNTGRNIPKGLIVCTDLHMRFSIIVVKFCPILFQLKSARIFQAHEIECLPIYFRPETTKIGQLNMLIIYDVLYIIFYVLLFLDPAWYPIKASQKQNFLFTVSCDYDVLQ